MKSIPLRMAAASVAVLLGAVLTGCGTTSPAIAHPDESVSAEKARLAELQKRVDQETEARRKAEEAARRAEDKARKAEEAARSAKASASSADPGDALLPPGARVGECFARVLVPPVYEEYTEEVLVKEASQKIAVVPAEYSWDRENVLVKEASARIEVVPAEYEWVEERVMVKPERSELRVVPAVYDTVTEEILVTPARTYWKKGRGLVEKVDNSTGEIMCLVEEPAVYKTVTKQVLVKPETVEEVTIPAEYTTLKKMVVKKEATTRSVEVPAQYDEVEVLRETTPAKPSKSEIPAEHRTLTKQRMVKASTMEWRRVICETNMSRGLVTELQRALKDRSHDPGPIDGVYGPLTQAAVRSFQKASDLPTGGLTHGTVKALGVKL